MGTREFPLRANPEKWQGVLASEPQATPRIHSIGQMAQAPNRTCAKWSPVLRWSRRVRVIARGHRVGSAILLALCVVIASARASATIVERVVAVVGERAILMSDLRDRARPLLVRISQELPVGAQRSAAISQLYKSVVDRK